LAATFCAAPFQLWRHRQNAIFALRGGAQHQELRVSKLGGHG